MGAWNDRKVTPGITELSRLRVHIDGAVCYIVVGSSYPGCAEAAKGGGVHSSKGIVSWVQNAVRQFVWYLLDVLMSERKDLLVREERRFVATGRSVVWQGRPSSYAISDKSWKHLSSKHTSKIDIRTLEKDKFNGVGVYVSSFGEIFSSQPPIVLTFKPFLCTVFFSFFFEN